MVNYVCIGKGTTDSNGVAHITHDCNGNPLSEVGYKGAGLGDTLIVASLDKPVASDSLISNVLQVSDVDNYVLGLTADKSIIQTGDTLSVSATLKNNNIPVSGKTVSFEVRKQSDDTLITTLTGTTNSSGVANVSYLGNHAGLLYIKAECNVRGILVSQPCTVTDCIKLDSGILDDPNCNNIWTTVKCDRTPTANGTTFITNASGTNGVYLVNNASYIIPIDTDWIIEFELKTANVIGIYLKSQNTSALSVGYYNTNNLNKCKIVYNAPNHQFKVYWNDSTTASTTRDLNSTTEPLRFYIEDYQGDMNLLLKNFKVYVI